MNRLAEDNRLIRRTLGSLQMDKQREGRIRWEIPAPVQDEFLGAWVEISFSKWRWIDGVEELAQLGDTHLDHAALPRDQVSSRGRFRVRKRRQKEASPLRIPGQDRIHPHDERVELRHVVPQEFLRRVVRDLAVLSDQARLELDVSLHGIHLRRIAEAEDAA